MATITPVEYERKKAHLRYDSAKKRWVGYQIDVRAGKKRYRNTFKTRREAESFIDELRKQSLYGRAGMKAAAPAAPKVSALFEKRVLKIANHAAKLRAKRVFAYFQKLLEYDLPITSVKTSHFREFNNSREEDGVKPETINREVNELASAFHSAAQMFPKELEDYEAPRIARPKVSKRKKAKHVITEAEAAAIIAAIKIRQRVREYAPRVASRPAVALMFELAWLLGLRIGEAEKLLKTDFDPKDESLRIVRWKTGDITTFRYLPDRAMEILREAIALSRTEFVFDVPCSRRTVESIIEEACGKAGLAYGRNTLDGVTFHSTRHSFTSRLVRVTDPATAAEFTGHSSKEMVDWYSHASDESKKEAMARMYGKKDTDRLRTIYEETRSGELGFESFLDALK